MPNDLTGQFIANTFQNLIQKPDIDKEEYYNGVGLPTYINGDPIGTVKMFYPIGGTLSTYFDTSTGLGNLSTGWDGWAMCDGRNNTPDLRGRFIVGLSNIDNTDYDYVNTEKNISDYNSFGNYGGVRTYNISSDQLPPHKHEFNYQRHYFGIQEGGSTGDPVVDTINSGGVPAYNSGNGDTNLGPTDPSGGTTQNGVNNTPPYYTLLYVIKIS